MPSAPLPFRPSFRECLEWADAVQPLSQLTYTAAGQKHQQRGTPRKGPICLLNLSETHTYTEETGIELTDPVQHRDTHIHIKNSYNFNLICCQAVHDAAVIGSAHLLHYI